MIFGIRANGGKVYSSPGPMTEILFSTFLSLLVANGSIWGFPHLDVICSNMVWFRHHSVPCNSSLLRKSARFKWTADKDTRFFCPSQDLFCNAYETRCLCAALFVDVYFHVSPLWLSWSTTSLQWLLSSLALDEWLVNWLSQMPWTICSFIWASQPLVSVVIIIGFCFAHKRSIVRLFRLNHHWIDDFTSVGLPP